MRISWLQVALALAQGIVYSGLGWVAVDRGGPEAGLLWAAAGGQLLALGATLARRRRLIAIGATASLLGVGVVWARLFLLVREINAVLGPDAGGAALSVLGSSLAALPWVLVVPIAQLYAAGRARYAAALGLVLLPSLPSPVVPALAGSPPESTPASAAPNVAVAVAEYAWTGRSSADGLPPEDTPVLLTVLRAGRREPNTTTRTTVGDAPAAAKRLIAGASRLPVALLVDVQRGELPGGWLRPGTDAPCAGDPADGATNERTSPVLLVRKLPHVRVLPWTSLPGTGRSTCRYHSAVVSDEGLVPLVDAWSAAPPINAATAREAVRAGAAHLLVNQKPGGRFTYIVTGPLGGVGPGYNYPRHAGTAWFLARCALALDDAAAGVGADLALAHLSEVTRTSPDGRAYVLDPDRRDGKSWIGTTALAILAQAARLRATDALAVVDREGAQRRLDAWTAQVVASVAPDGKILGDMRISDARFDPDQPANTYGEGQAMLALATVAAHPELLPGGAGGERATAVSEALARSVDYLEHGYYGTPHPTYVADEHWMCLTAHALAATPGGRSRAADGICSTYVAQQRPSRPRAGFPRPGAGSAGGGAEAVVAHAWDHRDTVSLAESTAYGQLFLNNQYRPADSMLLGNAAALLGGFRDGPGDLDVQIDAVQHIGGALLGVVALLEGQASEGMLP